MINEKTYPGVDYAGPGSTVNRNPDTGIRFGIISCSDVRPEALDDIYTSGRDLGHEAAVEEFKNKLESAITEFIECRYHDEKALRKIMRNVLTDYFSDSKWGDEKQSKLDDAVDAVVEDIYPDWNDTSTEQNADNAFNAIQDGFNDNYQVDESGPLLYEGEGYVLKTDSANDLWVLKSPYYTYAQFCSPCAPGAVHLSNPLIVGSDTLTIKEQQEVQKNTFEANTGYCLDHDFFEEGIAPYPVFSVKTDVQIIARKATVPCNCCDGSGVRPVANLAAIRGCSEQNVITGIEDGTISVEGFSSDKKTFQCTLCHGLGTTDEIEIEEVA